MDHVDRLLAVALAYEAVHEVDLDDPVNQAVPRVLPGRADHQGPAVALDADTGYVVRVTVPDFEMAVPWGSEPVAGAWDYSPVKAKSFFYFFLLFKLVNFLFKKNIFCKTFRVIHFAARTHNHHF